jgi:hypothetical protein
MIYTSNGEKCENVYHVLQDVPWTEPEMSALAGRFITWWDTEWRAHVPPSVSLINVVIKNLEGITAPGIELSTGLPHAGTDGARDQTPNNVTLAISWHTALRGRSYRGRTYHIGMESIQCLTGIVSPADIALFVARYTALITDIAVVAPQRLVVVSKFNNKVQRALGVATEIISCSVNNHTDSQRRRLGK